MSAEPTQTCQQCGRQVIVVENGRGFPPDVAKRKLARLCKEAGHVSQPRYRAGISPALVQKLRAGGWAS